MAAGKSITTVIFDVDDSKFRCPNYCIFVSDNVRTRGELVGGRHPPNQRDIFQNLIGMLFITSNLACAIGCYCKCTIIVAITTQTALYDVHTGFTASRNGPAVYRFMMQYLNFPTEASAKLVRDEYFERYHSTAKGLQMAEQEGRFPPAVDESHHQPISQSHSTEAPRFRTEDLADYWATQLDFSLLRGPKAPQFVQDLLALKQSSSSCGTGLNLIAFSNGPRKYVQRVLSELGLWDTVFDATTLFAVEDVLPHCKPEREAFELMFRKIGISSILPEQCIMVEDSMKNVRRAKELGMKTVLVLGSSSTTTTNGKRDGHRADAPQRDDPAVDLAIETIEDLRVALPGLWDEPAMFVLGDERCNS